MTSTVPDIPERNWTNPFPEGHSLHDLYGRRVRHDQDLVILIDDYHARRGTGKTVASLQLAEGMDQTDAGMTFEKVSLRPEEIRNAYASQPERSALVLDEGEIGTSNREAMSKTNRALREIMSTGRVELKYTIINTPSVGFIDKDLRLLADVWITMLRKGLGLVHFLKRQPYRKSGSATLLTEKKDLIEFSDIQKGTKLRKIYNKLTAKKREHIRGEGGTAFIEKDEHERALEKAREEARREQRDELLQALYSHPEADASQRILGEAAGISQQMVGNVVRQNGDS